MIALQFSVFVFFCLNETPEVVVIFLLPHDLGQPFGLAAFPL